MNMRLRAIAIVGALLGAGCSVGPKYKVPAAQ